MALSAGLIGLYATAMLVAASLNDFVRLPSTMTVGTVRLAVVGSQRKGAEAQGDCFGGCEAAPPLQPRWTAPFLPVADRETLEM